MLPLFSCGCQHIGRTAISSNLNTWISPSAYFYRSHTVIDFHLTVDFGWWRRWGSPRGSYLEGDTLLRLEAPSSCDIWGRRLLGNRACSDTISRPRHLDVFLNNLHRTCANKPAFWAVCRFHNISCTTETDRRFRPWGHCQQPLFMTCIREHCRLLFYPLKAKNSATVLSSECANAIALKWGVKMESEERRKRGCAVPSIPIIFQTAAAPGWATCVQNKKKMRMGLVMQKKNKHSNKTLNWCHACSQLVFRQRTYLLMLSRDLQSNRQKICWRGYFADCSRGEV